MTQHGDTTFIGQKAFYTCIHIVTQRQHLCESKLYCLHTPHMKKRTLESRVCALIFLHHSDIDAYTPTLLTDHAEIGILLLQVAPTTLQVQNRSTA